MLRVRSVIDARSALLLAVMGSLGVRFALLIERLALPRDGCANTVSSGSFVCVWNRGGSGDAT